MATDKTNETASLDTRKDAGKGPRGEVAYWLKEIEIAQDREKDWRKEGKKVWDRYRYDDRKQGIKKFNILWSNTEVQRPLLLSAIPQPDVRRRFRDQDPVGKESSDILERAVSFSVDAYNFESPMSRAVLDFLLPGRATVRVKYIPTFEANKIQQPTGEYDKNEVPLFEEVDQETLVYEETRCEYVKWTDFGYVYADVWEDVPACWFRHELTRDELVEKFPDFEDAKTIPLDQVKLGKEDEESDEHGDAFKRLLVYEIWDKDKRRVLWVAPSWEHGPIKEEEDPLELEGFFPVPEPAIMVGGTLLPIPEYRQYQDQAEELDEITARINGIVRAIKARGVYDSTLEEFARVMEAGDNTLVPAKNAMAYLEKGGLDKAVWFMPVDMLAAVLVQLSAQRESIKAEIYEIIGISDILRGQSNPNETLGAQRIKSNFGSSRIQEKQRAIHRYIRDIYRLKAEIIAEKFSPQTLQLMTGKQVTPEIMELLRADAVRSYRIDIETDSTVQGVLQEEQRNITELLTGIASFTEAVTPAVQSGAIPKDVATKILMSAVRRFKMGREVEDALNQIDDQQGQGQAPGIEEMMQSPEVQQIIQQQAEQMASQMEQVINAQTAQQESAAKLQQDQGEAMAKMQLAQSEAAAELQLEREKLAATMQLEREKLAELMQIKREEIAADAMIDLERIEAQEETKERGNQMNMAAKVAGKAMDREDSGHMIIGVE